MKESFWQSRDAISLQDEGLSITEANTGLGLVSSSACVRACVRVRVGSRTPSGSSLALRSR